MPFGCHFELIFHGFICFLHTLLELHICIDFAWNFHEFRCPKNHVFTVVLQCFLRVWHIRKPYVFPLDFYMDSDMFLDAFGHNFNTFWRLCFADSLGGVFCCFCMPNKLPKWHKNHPVELPMVPKTIKILNFSRKGRFGSVLGRLVIFGRPILRWFGHYLAHVLLVFSHIFTHFTIFRRIWVGKGEGEHNFLDHTLSHQNLSSAPKPLTGTVRTCFATWIKRKRSQNQEITMIFTKQNEIMQFL